MQKTFLKLKPFFLTFQDRDEEKEFIANRKSEQMYYNSFFMLWRIIDTITVILGWNESKYSFQLMIMSVGGTAGNLLAFLLFWRLPKAFHRIHASLIMLSIMHFIFANGDNLKNNSAESALLLMLFLNNQTASAILLSSTWVVTSVTLIVCHIGAIIFFSYFLDCSIFAISQHLVANTILLVYSCYFIEKSLKHQFFLQKQLESANNQLLTVIEHIPEGVLIFNPDTQEILHKNKRLIDIFKNITPPPSPSAIQEPSKKSAVIEWQHSQSEKYGFSSCKSQNRENNNVDLEIGSSPCRTLLKGQQLQCQTDSQKLQAQNIDEVIQQPYLSVYVDPAFKVKKQEEQSFSQDKDNDRSKSELEEENKFFNIQTAATKFTNDHCFVFYNKIQSAHNKPQINRDTQKIHRDSESTRKQSILSKQENYQLLVDQSGVSAIGNNANKSSQLFSKEVFSLSSFPMLFNNQPATMFITQSLTQSIKALHSIKQSMLYESLMEVVSTDILSQLESQLDHLENIKPFISKEGQVQYDILMKQQIMMLSTINDMVDILQIKKGTFIKQEEQFNVKECINEMKDLVFRISQKKGLKVVIAFAQEVPETLLGDSSRIKQVLLNLLINALKYSNKGQITVYVDYQEMTNTLSIDVADQGFGIKEREIQNLFIISKVSDSRSQLQGPCVGLYICKKICKQFNGNIQCRSLMGMGSTFKFSIQMGKPVQISPGNDAINTADQVKEEDIKIALCENNVSELEDAQKHQDKKQRLSTFAPKERVDSKKQTKDPDEFESLQSYEEMPALPNKNDIRLDCLSSQNACQQGTNTIVLQVTDDVYEQLPSLHNKSEAKPIVKSNQQKERHQHRDHSHSTKSNQNDDKKRKTTTLSKDGSRHRKREPSTNTAKTKSVKSQKVKRLDKKISSNIQSGDNIRLLNNVSVSSPLNIEEQAKYKNDKNEHSEKANGDENSDSPNKVLVVDDNVFNIVTLKMVLEAQFNIKADQALNGLEAVNAVKDRKQNPYKLIFMDCNMPVMDGLEATTKINEIYKIDPACQQLTGPYVVALTAYNTGDQKEQCEKAGMRDFLTKPVNPQAVQKVLKFVKLI